MSLESKYHEEIEKWLKSDDKASKDKREAEHKKKQDIIELKAKAFDIINKKSVDMFCLPFLIEKYGDNAINKYNLMNTGLPRLDQEEFDLLKQALEVDE